MGSHRRVSEIRANCLRNCKLRKANIAPLECPARFYKRGTQKTENREETGVSRVCVFENGVKQTVSSENLIRKDRWAGLFLGLALLKMVELQDVIRHFAGVAGRVAQLVGVVFERSDPGVDIGSVGVGIVR